jgi:hypothetical protein
LDYPNRVLDSEAYENFKNAHRMPYLLFEAYQNLKHRRGERDLADRCVTLHRPRLLLSRNLLLPNVRTHTLLNGLKENGLKGELVDFV